VLAARGHAAFSAMVYAGLRIEERADLDLSGGRLEHKPRDTGVPRAGDANDRAVAGACAVVARNIRVACEFRRLGR